MVLGMIKTKTVIHRNINPVFNDPQFNRNEEFHYV